MSVKSKIVEGKFLATVRANIDRRIGIAARKVLYSNNEVNPRKVMFMTYRNAYDCNPKYIAEELLRRGTKAELVWAVPAKGPARPDRFPAGIRTVARNSYEFYEELGSARVWVDNSLNCVWMPFPKKPSQLYLETWHGSMGLKRVGKDDVTDPRWLQAAARVTAGVDYCISNSTFETGVYRETHWPNSEVLEFGHPRNDILFERDPERMRKLRELVCCELDMDPADKILLYAPTFREDGSLPSPPPDLPRVCDALAAQFGGTWRAVARLHFHNRSLKPAAVGLAGDIVDATAYPDMQELLAVADAGITDYSSWCCDYVLTGRPCFLYVPDLDAYESGRGLYYPLTETPFPVCRTQGELESAIATFDDDVYEQRCAEFLAARGSFEDGHAAERVADIIEAALSL